MKAIVYTSNTGFTEKYAKMLGKKIELPIYSAEEAKKKLEKGSEIIYMGWLMASKIKGYTKAAKNYNVRLVVGVGMGENGSQIPESRKSNSIPENIPLYVLQGGFDITKLHGIYKMMMNFAVKANEKNLKDKKELTPEEKDSLELIKNGGSRVKEENLDEIIKKLKEM